jgi:integrase/recombinase XerD
MTRTRTSLPFDHWPVIDRQLWAAAQTKGGLFEPDGKAAHWADATRKQVEKGYAKWLGYLALIRQLDPHITPVARISPDRLRSYAQWMEESHLASTTLVSRMRDLREALRVMEPAADLALIQKVISALNARATPSRNKHSRIMHPEVLLAGTIRELSAIPEGVAPNPKIRACWYRDALIFMFLICRPIRLKNVTELRIGTHLINKDTQWDCHLAAEETKEKAPLSFTLPELIGPYLSEYLECYRPLLLGGRQGDHLWISIRRTPMSKQAVYDGICKLTERVFDKHINPHLLRDCAASAMATDDPEHILAAARILGHASLQTTNRHYNQSQMTAAGNILHEVLADLRNVPEDNCSLHIPMGDWVR